MTRYKLIKIKRLTAFSIIFKADYYQYTKPTDSYKNIKKKYRHVVHLSPFLNFYFSNRLLFAFLKFFYFKVNLNFIIVYLHIKMSQK